jgi:hypothetical protein
LLNFDKRIVVIRSLELRERFELRIIGSIWILNGPSPKLALRERFQIEARYDAEVVLATFESLEESRMGGGIGVDDGPGRQDDLEVYNGIAAKTSLGGEE